MTTDFRNIRYTLNESAVLSTSTWTDGAILRFAVAILRKSGNAWKVDGTTAVEGWVTPVSASESAVEAAEMKRTGYIVDCGNPLIVQEIGEVPVRFYRDNVIEKAGRKQ